MKNHEKLHEFYPRGPSLDAERHWIWNISSHSSDNNLGQRISTKDLVFFFDISHTSSYLNECTRSPALATLNGCQGWKVENRIGNQSLRDGRRPSETLHQNRFFCFVILGSEFSIPTPHRRLQVDGFLIRFQGRWRWQRENRNLAQTKININHKWISSKRCSGKTRELFFLTAWRLINPIHYLFIDFSAPVITRCLGNKLKFSLLTFFLEVLLFW